MIMPKTTVEPAARVAGLFPAGAFALSAGVPDDGAWGQLYAEERALVEDAVAKRRREFATGRVLARRAMAALGIAPAPILRDPQGAPVWSDGYVGSISHSAGLAAVVVARSEVVRGLGVDVESRTRAFPWQALGAVATPEEQVWLAALPPPWRELAAYGLFSAKESTIKCLYSAGLPLLHFTQFTVGLDLAAGRYTVAGLPAALQGRLGWDASHVYTGAWWPEER